MKRIVKKILYCLFISSVLLNISGCSSLDNQQLNSTFQQVSSLLDDEKSKNIKIIKNLILEGYKFEDLIENYMDNVTYEFYDSKSLGRYITVKGNIDFVGTPVFTVIQFKKVNDDLYEFSLMKLNDQVQDSSVGENFYHSMVESAKNNGLKKVSNASGDYALHTAKSNNFSNANDNNEIDEHKNSGEYILPTADSEYISVEYMKSMVTNGDTSLIRLAVNEMFARHGATFSKQKNIDYFSSKSWYNPIEGVSDEYIQENLFNNYEKANLKNLLYVESLYK